MNTKQKTCTDSIVNVMAHQVPKQGEVSMPKRTGLCNDVHSESNTNWKLFIGAVHDTKH